MRIQRQFETEKELSDFLASDSRWLPKPSERFVRREVSMGSCIPDLVFVDIPRRPTEHRGRITYVQAAVLASLRVLGETTPAGLCERVFLDEDTARTAIETLKRFGWIEAREGLLKPEGWTLEHGGRVTAVESKLHRWRDALRQAAEYRAFADRVYVAVDAAHVGPARRNLDLFCETGIGLCAVKKTGVELLLESRPHCDTSAEREYLLWNTLSCGTRIKSAAAQHCA